VEWSIGRYGGQFGHHSTPGIFDAMGKRRFWKYFGVFGLWTNLIIASYYLYIETWTAAYAGNSILGGFTGKTPEQVNEFLASLTGETANNVIAVSGWGMGLFFLCIGLNIWILSRGLAKGIELVAKIGMPLLILFAAIIAVRGLMIDPATDPDAVAGPLEGLNFVWQPKYDSLANPSVWLAAAGQIFFTLSIGMGSIHCFASYLKDSDDVALNGSATAWTNEFCEVILGGTILIPIAVAYLGLDRVQDMTGGGSGWGLNFQVMPTLFTKWGAFGPAAGFLWFGLLFFAAITSSLAMGQPIMAFLQDEFKITRERSAVLFGLMLLPLAAAVAMTHGAAFFTEFDDWAGTFALVVLAFVECILFAWVFGMEKAWAELNKGADMKVPIAFKYIIKWVTPVFLAVILVSYTFKPEGSVPKIDDAGSAVLDPKTKQPVMEPKGWQPYITAPFTGKAAPEWKWAGSGMIGKLMHNDIGEGDTPEKKQFNLTLRLVHDIARVVLVGVFILFCILVALAWGKRRAEGRA